MRHHDPTTGCFVQISRNDPGAAVYGHRNSPGGCYGSWRSWIVPVLRCQSPIIFLIRIDWLIVTSSTSKSLPRSGRLRRKFDVFTVSNNGCVSHIPGQVVQPNGVQNISLSKLRKLGLKLPNAMLTRRRFHGRHPRKLTILPSGLRSLSGMYLF